jgi:hypothetical protein
MAGADKPLRRSISSIIWVLRARYARCEPFSLHPKAIYTDYVTMRWPKFRIEKWIPAPDASTLTLRGDN